jgi:hypothetical protein
LPAHQLRRIAVSHEKLYKKKLCPVHRGLIAMSGRVAHQPRRITMSHEKLYKKKLCPVHRGFIAMSGLIK